MAIEVFLDLIRDRFSPAEGQIIINSLQQDPLVWQFVKNENKSLPYFEAAQTDLSSFAPGKIAAWLIEQATEVPLTSLNQVDFTIPNEIRKNAAKTLETVLNTGLPPADLMMAGMMALTLRERRRLKGNWQGFGDEIFLKGNQNVTQKNYEVWRTPFACLFEFCPDFDSIITEFLQSKSTTAIAASIPILIHTFLANPLQPRDLLDQLFSFTKNLSIDKQLESLNWLEKFYKPDLRKTLADNLIQTRTIVETFAKTFSELEALSTNPVNADPLSKQINYTLPEEINRIAAFYYFTGDKKKAAETYKKSSDVLDFIKSQTFFQSLLSNPTLNSPSHWMRIINSVPNSKQARMFYIQSLVKDGMIDEASKHIKELPDSPEKRLFNIQISDPKDSQVKSFGNTLEHHYHTSNNNFLTKPGYYVHNVKFDTHQKILNELIKHDSLGLNLTWVENYIEAHPNDLQFITLAKDLFTKTNHFSKAIELASYLERIEPNINAHKRTLAKLYSLTKRWSEAFSTLQELTKSQSSPKIEDLEGFAQAALNTKQIDVAISICQNILKQDADNIKALVLLGEGYMLKGDVVKSIQHMEQVVEKHPDQATTWLTLARLWQNCEQTERAFEILNEAILTIPESPELLNALGKIYLEKQAPSDAIIYLKKAYAIEPNNLACQLNLSQAQYQLGQYETAWHHLEPFMNNHENNPAVAKLLGHVLLAMGKKEKAEPVLIFSAEYFPEDIETILAATRVVLTRAEISCQELPDDNLAKIENILKKALGKFHNNFEIKLHLADIQRLKGLYQEALDTYIKLSEDRLLTEPLSDWRLEYGIGKSAIALGNHELGLASLNEAASKQPENQMVLHTLAEGYQSAGLNEKAQSTAKTALKIAPQDLNNIHWYARFKTNSNQPEEAVRAIKDALQINPGCSELKLWLSKTLTAIGSVDEAKEIVTDLINNANSTHKELHQAAYICVQLNELDLAKNALEKSHHQSISTDPILLMDLAQIYSLTDQKKKALETLNCNEELIIQSPQLALLKSDILCNLGLYKVAFATLKDIETTIKNRVENGNEKTNTKVYSPLLYAYDFSLKEYFYRLGQLSREMGAINDAQSYLSKALELDPDNFEVRNATMESLMVGLKFDKAFTTGSQNVDSVIINEGINYNRLDLLCSQTEILIYQDKLDQASALFNKLSQFSPAYPRVLALQSRLATSRGEIDQAKEHLHEAVKSYQAKIETIQSSSLTVAFRKFMNTASIAEAALTLENHQSAIEFYQQTSNMFDNQPLLNWRYALALIKSAESQQIAEALSITTHAPGKEILAEKNQLMAQTLLETLQGYFSQEKIQCLKARMVAAFSGEWPLHLNTDACLIGPEEAAAVLLGTDDDALIQDILEAYPKEPEVLQAYGIHALRNKKNDGIIYVEKAIKMDVSNPINHALLAMLNISDSKQALNSLETALTFWPDETEWHALAADFYIEIEDTESASKHIQLALNTHPEDMLLWEKSAEIEIQNNNLPQAKQDLEKSISLKSSNPKTWLRMAEVNHRLGNMPEVIQNFKTAGELDPNDSDIATQEIQFLINQKHYEQAERKADKTLQIDPKNIQVWTLLVKALAQQGKFNRALETLTLVEKKYPNNTRLALERIKIKKYQDGAEAILPELVNLAQENPNDPNVLTTLTDWLIQTNRLEEAKETAQTILRINPEQAEVHLMLGRLQRKNGQLDQAISHLSDAITLKPDLVEAYIELGKTYQERRDLEQAIKVFQKGSQANASDPRPYYFAGMALKECKDYSGAEAMLKQSKKYSPNDANVIRQLGVITALNLINNLRETR